MLSADYTLVHGKVREMYGREYIPNVNLFAQLHHLNGAQKMAVYVISLIVLQ